MHTATRRGASIALAAATIGALTFGTLSAAYADTPEETFSPSLVPEFESPIATEPPEVVPDTVRPTISIDSPSPGTAARADLTVAITGSDNAQLSRLSANLYGPAGIIRAIGSTPANGVLESPSTRSWTVSTSDLAEGTYTVRAGARDASNNVATTSTDFIVDRTRPTVTIVTPATGLVSRGGFEVVVEGADDVALSRLAANLYDESNSTFLAAIGSTPANGSLSNPSTSTWTIPDGLADGTYTIRASARDAAGNVKTTTVTVVIDRTRPIVEILNPLSGSVFRDGFDVTVRGSDLNGLARLTANLYDASNSVFLGPIGTSGSDLPTDAESASRSWPIPTGLDEGTYTIRAGARDTAGNVETTTMTFTVDRTRPSIVISQPTAGSLQNGAFDVTVIGNDEVGLKRLAANLYDESNVSFLGPIGSTSGAVALGSTTASETWSFPSGMPDGVYTIRASARDLANNVSTTTTRVTLDTAGPTVAYLTPSIGDEFSDDFIARGTAFDTLTGVANNELTVHVRAVNPGTGNCGAFLSTDVVEIVGDEWQVEISVDALEPGRYCITALGSDNAGNAVPAGGATLKTFTVVEPTIIEEILGGIIDAPSALADSVQQLFAPASPAAEETETEQEPTQEATSDATTASNDDTQLETQAFTEADTEAPVEAFPWWIIAVILAVVGLATAAIRRFGRTA